MQRTKDNLIKYALPTFLVIGTVWFLTYSGKASEAAYTALKTCASVIVPSLFPYMVISSMLVRTGAAQRFGEWFSLPVRVLFHLPGCAAGAVVLGALCGFPVGAKTACELYEQGSITRRECERLIAIANNTGPSFVIEVVGAHFWGSRGMGVVIYTAQILSATLIGYLISRKDKMPADVSLTEDTRCNILQCLADTITHSARSVVSVCGFIVFFGISASLIQQVLTGTPANVAAPVLSALLEFSNGASDAAELGGITGAFLTGFAVGWSGISVFAQCTAFTASHGVSLRLASVCKAAQGCLTGLAASAYYAFWFTPSVTASTVIPKTDISAAFVAAEFLLLALASVQFPRGNS